MQGLGSCGIASRAVLRAFGGNEGSAFKSVRVRFSKPVLPGQTLETQMWLDADGSAAPAAPLAEGVKRVVFRTVCVETGDTVIVRPRPNLRCSLRLLDLRHGVRQNNAYMDLQAPAAPTGRL